MALKSVLLMLLSRGEATGYELAGEFDQAVGYFWKATHQQIYRDLAAMEAQGWVSRRIEPQVGKPDRKLYRVTSKGDEALRAWLAEPAAMRRTTDELLIKIAAGSLMGLDALVAEIERQIAAHRLRLETFEAIEREHYGPEILATMPLDYQLLHLTLRCGIHAERAWLVWAEESLATIGSLQANPA